MVFNRLDWFWLGRAIARPLRRFIPFVGVVMFVAIAVLGSRQPAAASEARLHSDLEFGPPPEIVLPPYEQFTLANGMAVYLIEDRELPLISGQALVRTGSRWEDPSLTGLAAVTGAALRSGGTERHPAAELDQLLEDRAAAIESSIDLSSGSVSFSALSEDTDFILDLFAEVLQMPAFAPDKIAFERQQLRGAIARRNDNPGAIASREFDKLIYGDQSPYAATIEYDTLSRIDRAAVVEFYRRYFVPSNLILGISGDFDTATLRRAIEQRFGSWSAIAPPPPPIPTATPSDREGQLFIIDRPQLTQSSVLMGHLGGQVSDPDYAQLSVANGILNGFGGRLFNELRSSQGLAYSVYGYWSPEFDYPGRVIAGGQTRSDGTVPFIEGLRREFQRLRDEPVSAEELAYAQDSTLNSFIFRFADPSQTLSRLMTYAYYGYPEDFIFRYQEAVKATTIADVQRVAQAHLHPDRLTTLVVGNRSAIAPPLETIGKPIRAIDVTIPPDPSA